MLFSNIMKLSIFFISIFFPFINSLKHKGFIPSTHLKKHSIHRHRHHYLNSSSFLSPFPPFASPNAQ